MNADQFWTIIEETHDKSMKVNEENLIARLVMLPRKEIIAFDRMWTICYYEIYTWPLWGVARLKWGWCSDDGFMDWRNWVISCGRTVFETARDRPDDLVPWIDSQPEAGCEGVGYARTRALEKKSSLWAGASPTHGDLSRPPEPSGNPWKTDADLQQMLPKTYSRYVEKATPQEKNWQDPEWIKKTFNPRLGETKEFKATAENLKIEGEDAQRITLIPILKRKPWWKFWL